MTYPVKLQKRFKKGNIEIGDTIEIISDKKVYRGILMPHHEFSGEDIVTIKLDTGYNVGVSIDDQSEMKLLEKAVKSEKKRLEIQYDDTKPIISILGTGGTIASYVDYRTGAVHPALDATDLAYSVPELAEMCNIRAKVLFSIFSEDMTVVHWQMLAKEIANELNNGSSGVIIAHGTDTMGYTSSALSFMLKNLTGPVILVGSQRSSDRPSSDANMNLISASHIAKNSDLGEVVVVMHGETSDSYITIHRGTRVRKMHTSRRDAFQSINEEPLGMIRDGEIVMFQEYKKRGTGKVEVKDKMENKVGIFYCYPEVSVEYFDFLAERNKGIIIAGTGLGHAPRALLENIRNAISSGVHVVMTSQCLYGTVNMNVYSSGRDLLKAGVISGEDMLPETAYIKLMWVLGQTQDSEEVKNLMETNIVGEISQRRNI